jgi:LysM repeat protein
LAQVFKPYTTPPKRHGRHLKWVMLTLIVVIVGLVILIKTQTAEKPAKVQSAPPQVKLDNVLPPSRPASEPAAPSTPSAGKVEPAAGGQAPSIQTDSAEPPVAVSQTEPAETTPTVQSSVQQTAAQTPDDASSADKTAPQAKRLIEEALTLRDQGRIIAARDKLNQALNMQLSPQIRTGVMTQLANLADKWLFSRDVLQGDELTGYYLVKPGDLLAKIGRQHKVPYEILMRINGIERPELLQAGRQIKVIHGPFHAVVNRSTYTLDLYLQNMYVKTYRVGLGRPEHTTPTGRWVVAPGGKMVKPTWTDPDTGKTYKGSDPEYPLGSRWIALEGIEGAARGRTGFALHGTHEPETIGTQSSRGCIRLHNGDIIELYEMLEPGQSNVQVID